MNETKLSVAELVDQLAEMLCGTRIEAKKVCAVLGQLECDASAVFVMVRSEVVLLIDGSKAKVPEARRGSEPCLKLTDGDDEWWVDLFGILRLISADESLHVIRVLSKYDSCAELSQDADELEGTIRAAQRLSKFSPSEFGRGIERECVLQALRERDTARVPLQAVYFGRNFKVASLPAQERRTVLNKLVDELIKTGMDMADIRDYFLQLLKEETDTNSMEFVLRLAGAKVFDRKKGYDSALAAVLHDCYLERFWQDLLDANSGNALLMPFICLVRRGMIPKEGIAERIRDDEDKSLIENGLVTRLSLGELAKIWQIVELVGAAGALGIYSPWHHCDAATTSYDDLHAYYVERVMRRYARMAFQKARSEGRQGTAAALAEMFGEGIAWPDEFCSVTESELAAWAVDEGSADKLKRYREAKEEVENLHQTVPAEQAITLEARYYYRCH